MQYDDSSDGEYDEVCYAITRRTIPPCMMVEGSSEQAEWLAEDALETEEVLNTELGSNFFVEHGGKKPKEKIGAAVKTLLEWKAEYKAVKSTDWEPVGRASKKQGKPRKAATKEVKAKEKPKAPEAGVTSQ